MLWDLFGCSQTEKRALSMLRFKLTKLRAVVADPCQRHRLVAARADLADPSVLNASPCVLRGSSTDADASLAGAKSSHLFFCRQLRRTQNGAVPPLEVAAVGVVPQSGFRSCQSAVKVNRVHHVSDIWMLYGGRHGGHFTARSAS
jgi:hypothetical protein